MVLMKEWSVITEPHSGTVDCITRQPFYVGGRNELGPKDLDWPRRPWIHFVTLDTILLDAIMNMLKGEVQQYVGILKYLVPPFFIREQKTRHSLQAGNGPTVFRPE